jgi:hypothetical protein
LIFLSLFTISKILKRKEYLIFDKAGLMDDLLSFSLIQFPMLCIETFKNVRFLQNIPNIIIGIVHVFSVPLIRIIIRRKEGDDRIFLIQHFSKIVLGAGVTIFLSGPLASLAGIFLASLGFLISMKKTREKKDQELKENQTTFEIPFAIFEYCLLIYGSTRFGNIEHMWLIIGLILAFVKY